ncbi:tetratricopeptide repeat protein [Flavobacteriaceae bacterium D16]|nr:tetratricopeptide repeat protein [Flavobacteriaceae bacterium D16]
MKMKNSAALLCLWAMAISLSAQESKIFTHDQKRYHEALSLYNNKQYQAAQTLFQKVKAETRNPETEANSAYYVANAAVRLNQLGADGLMEDFVEDYPTSTKRNSAFMDVADYYFTNGKYPYALKWYRKVETGSVAAQDRERFNFNLGYALYASKKPKEAESYFNRVVNSPEYGSQAKYYLGYIAYQEDDYERANERFDQITDQEVLNEKLSYYQADMNFKLGNFQEAIDLAKKQLEQSDRREISELNKIIGESYFNLGQYNTAIPYLEAYKGKRGKWSNTDYYLLGYSYYQQEDYANAIQQFNKIIGGTNSVSQNAYYHLAECYLKLDKKSEALNAFRNAAQMDFNADIEKDASLNYARLGYEIGNPYESVPEVLQQYLKDYPGDENSSEIQELLVDSFITSGNFEGALELLENNRGYASKATYQKVAYYRGVELYLETDYTAALTHFDKSLKSREDQLFAARAQYWKAESAYQLNRFEEARKGYLEFLNNPRSPSTEEYANIYYNLAYAAFKLKDYSNAIQYFKRVSSQGQSNDRKYDALVRMGDCYFVTRQYANAIAAYDQVIQSTSKERDYAAYQKAMSFGFVGKQDDKLRELNRFINSYSNSSLRDDAMFEMGSTYIKQNQQDLGLQTYERLIGEFARSPFVPRAMLRQGLVYYNGSQNEEALNKFRSVVSTYPKSPEARQAVATAKLIYVDLGRVDEYAQWVKGIDFVEVTDSELDKATYESAEKQRIEGRTDAAIRGYTNYLKDFPNGLFAVEVNFKLAQLHYAQENWESALPGYQLVADAETNSFSEQALTRTCELLLRTSKNKQAIPYLIRLESMAQIAQNRTFAQSNLMKTYYEQGAYPKTLEYADKVLAAGEIDNRIRSDAKIMIARSAIKTNDQDLAAQAYREVLPIATGAIAAEALYYDAYFKEIEKDYEGSNTAVQQLAKTYPAYREWGGKGLIIMARNFYNLEDAYQATYILESVTNNFKEYPEVVEEASAELKRIKTLEAERNSSINPEGN